MHKNTLLLVILLAVVAALVVGVQIGRGINPSLSQSPSPTPLPATPTPELPSLLSYTNTFCGFSFSYPSSHTLTSGASGSAVLSDATSPQNPILMTCQADIPRPPLIEDRIQDASIAGVIDAKIYHDASPQDGTPISALIFNNPNNGLDIFISGIGSAFTQVISSVQILP